MSKRKPYNDHVGYVASRRNDVNRGWVVIYDAVKQDIDVETRWAVVCETHGTICGVSSVAMGRPFLKVPSFCEECMREAYNREGA